MTPMCATIRYAEQKHPRQIPGKLVKFYGIHRYDRLLPEKLAGPEDDVVVLRSQRYPEKFSEE